MKVEIKKYSNLKTQSDAVIHFLQVMDVEMVSDILDDNRTYQEFEKHVFIQKLGRAMDEFIENGDTFLNCHKGFCGSEICNYKCSGFSFIGNHSKNYMDLIIEIKEGVVQDIYKCSLLKNIQKGIEKNNKISIY